jgi:cyclopropane fatty-acyl-phospholipid synthase-like methyltransferase
MNEMNEHNIFAEIDNSILLNNNKLMVNLFVKINPFESIHKYNELKLLTKNNYFINKLNDYLDILKNICNIEIDEFGNTILHILSIVNNGDKILRKIKDYIQDFNKNGENKLGGLHPPIIKAARYGNINNFLFLLENVTGEEFYKNYNYYGNNRNILIASCYNSDMRIMKHIINLIKNQNINLKDTWFGDYQINAYLVGIFSDHIPNKYKLRRLKLLSSIINFNEYFEYLLINCPNDNYKVLEIILKYYKGNYKIELENTYHKLLFDLEKFEEKQISNILTYFNSKIEIKNILLSIIQTKRCINNYIFFQFNKYLLKNNFDIINSLESYELFPRIVEYHITFGWNENDTTLCQHCNNQQNNCRYNLLNLFSNNKMLYSRNYCKELIKRFNYYNPKSITIFILLTKCNPNYNNILFSKNTQTNNKYKRTIKCATSLKLFLIRICNKKAKCKIIAFHKKFDPVLNSILTFSPNYQIPVLAKGSFQYNENKQKMKLDKFPIHINKCQMIWQEKNKCFIKEKADGIYSTKLSINYFPYNKIFINKEIKSEFIEELNLYLIFDISINHQNILERYFILRDLHPYTEPQINEISTIKEFIFELKKERSILKNFLMETENITTPLWYPKAMWKIKKDSKLISAINDLLVLNSDTEEYNYIINNGLFNIDGIIIQPVNGNTESKIKPLEHLTIDILWNGDKWITREKKIIKNVKSNFKLNNNTIYRCYWNKDNWIPREVRWDKNKPNPYSIINDLENFHIKPWSSKDIYNYSSTYYKVNTKNISSELIQIFRKQREIQKNIFQQNNLNKRKKWLDIGCGKGGSLNNIMSFNPSKYVGIDSDPYCIWEIKERWSNRINNSDYILHDMNKDNLILKDNFDYIICNFTIHFGSKNSRIWNLWINKINEISKQGTIFMFNFLDVIKINEYYKIDEKSYFKLLKNNNLDQSLNQTWIDTYFSWVHDKPIKESILNEDIYIKSFENLGWKLLQKKSFNNNNFNSLYKWITLEKN